MYEYVVEDLGFQILNGDYQPGETLPNEDTLCKSFDVSRGVLREATKILTQKGLIRTRPKIGTQVQSRSQWNLFDGDVLIWKLKSGGRAEFLKQVTEVRRIIESEAVRFAAERAGEDEIVALNDHYAALSRALEDEATYDYEHYLATDMAFHMAILDACHNELLAQIGHTMRQAVYTSRKADTRDISIQRASLPYHRDMVDAIAKRDPESAYQASQKMFHQVWDYLPKSSP